MMPEPYFVQLASKMFDRGQDQKAHMFVDASAALDGSLRMHALDIFATARWFRRRGAGYKPADIVRSITAGMVDP